MADWYYGENGQQIGPLDENAIRMAIGQGRLNQQTLVWREGMPSWTALANVPELFSPSVVGPAYPGYGPGAAPMMMRTSGVAIASMVCGLVGLLGCIFFWGILGIPAVVCGHMAMHSIANSPVPVAGRGMAITGLIMGYLQILMMLGMIGAIIAGSLQTP